jgi:putative phosphoribosyl transferase
MSGLRLPLQDRVEAGRGLGAALRAYRGRKDVLVLALPRGGVPVACEVADALGAEVDLLIVRKLGTPGQEELALGAIASGGVRVLNRSVVESLRISDQAIAEAERRERREIERRERAYRGQRPRPEYAGRCVILVDDGVATGATMRAGIAALRQAKPSRIVAAVPVAPAETVDLLRSEADDVVCLATPEPFGAIGYWYVEFPQLGDEAVRARLAQSWAARPEPAAPLAGRA